MVEERSREEIIEEEAFLIERSGEIPEVALYSAIHYLTEDPEGPRLRLEAEELRLLHRAVMDRYLFIILRDLTPRNRDKSIYRGVERAIINWSRLRSFADKWGYGWEEELKKVRGAARAFLRQEIADVKSGSRRSCVNCTADELRRFLQELGVEDEEIWAEIEAICCTP